MGRWNTEMERGILICSHRARLRLQASRTPFRVAVRVFIEAKRARVMYRIAPYCNSTQLEAQSMSHKT